MTDYSKLKVADLKDELKARGIPIAGLKLKQNFIDKLLEADAEGQTAVNDTASAPTDGAQDVEESQEAISTEAQKERTTDNVAQQAGTIANAQAVKVESSTDAEDATAVTRSEDIAMDTATIQIDRAQTVAETTIKDAPAQKPIETPAQDVGGTFSTEAEPVLETSESGRTAELASIPLLNGATTPSEAPQSIQTPPPSSFPMPSTATSTPSSIPVPATEVIEDSKKRKRRSVTPPPKASEVAQKRAKANDGSPRVTRLEDGTQDEGKVSQETKDVARSLEGDMLESGQVGVAEAEALAPAAKEAMAEPKPEDRRLPRPSIPELLTKSQPLKDKSVHDVPLEEIEERTVTPALHPATSSLYLRNFKRPLHLPTLRSHLATVAKASTSAPDTEEDPIITYYLDSIRTHGFVSFTSISAASRVRSALHDVRFPDEKTRDPLWVDFVPNEKVQEWIDIETNTGGGRGMTKRWEVVYEEGPNGIEAVLQEQGATGGPRRPSSVSQRQPSMSEIRRQPSTSETERLAQLPGVHPDRLPLVPQQMNATTNALREDTSGKQQPEGSSGTGFRALDELFSYTTAKPKLYFKPVSPQVVEQRMDAIKNLRVGHAGMGKSGDEDMKRYSFELYKGEEEWVDKGPEFGFGRRGVERLSGVARGGGFRGRGRGGFRDRDDTWRAPPRR